MQVIAHLETLDSVSRTLFLEQDVTVTFECNFSMFLVM